MPRRRPVQLAKRLAALECLGDGGLSGHNIRPNADPEALSEVWAGLLEAGEETIAELAARLGVDGDILRELAARTDHR